MKFTERYSRLFQLLLPSPLSIALLLSLITITVAYIFTASQLSPEQNYLITLLEFWERGLWNEGLMVFALQMILMLVLGHILAMSPVVGKFIDKISVYATTNANSAAMVCFSTITVALFNWGLGLIFGAIIARKIGEKAQREGFELNYPLIGAAGYSGLMVWHGGISGSSTAKVAENGHLASLMEGILSKKTAGEFTGNYSIF
ncbi:TIGR00366 family protein [Vicingaceae bacterium]|nr:TIGR00366 family protein [bacterium]MDC1450841.1 TIGR00366 family protein [Vicingaceae bacterium]